MRDGGIMRNGMDEIAIYQDYMIHTRLYVDSEPTWLNFRFRALRFCKKKQGVKKLIVFFSRLNML